MWTPGLLLLLAATLGPRQAGSELFAEAERARQQDTAEAAALFERLFEEHPLHLDGHVAYQKLLQYLGREEELRGAYAARLEAEPERALWYLLHGRLLHDPPREEAVYRAGLERDPGHFELHFALRSALARQRRWEEALAVLEAAAGLRPEDDEAHVMILNMLAALERPDEGVERYRARRQAEPDEPRWVGLLGIACVMAERRSEAVELLTAYRAARPDDPRAAAYLGTAQLQAGDLAGARSALAEACELDPYTKPVLELAAVLHAIVDQDAGGHEHALRYVRLEPTHARAHLLHGYWLMSEGRFDEATARFERARLLDPSDSDPHKGLAGVAVERQEYARAAEHFEAALELDPRSFDVHLALAPLYRRLGDDAAAERVLTQADELRRSSSQSAELMVAKDSEGSWSLVDREEREATLRGRLAGLHLRAGRNAAALELYAEMVAADPESVALRWKHAVLMERAGHLAEAAQAFEQLAVELLGSDPRGLGACAAIRAADCQWSLGEHEKARAAYRGVLKQHAEIVPAHEHLEALVAGLDRAPAEPRRQLLKGLDLEPIADPQRAFARTIAAVLGQLGLEADEQSVLEQVGPPRLPDTLRLRALAERRDDLELHVFEGRWETLCAQLDAGRPMLILRSSPDAQGESGGGLSVLEGYDEELRAVLIESANALDAMSRLPAAVLEHAPVFLLVPRAGLTGDEVAGLPGRAVYEALLEGMQCRQRGDAEGELRWILKARDQGPEHPLVMLELATTLWNAGQGEEGLAVLERGRAVAPHDTTIAFELAKMRALSGHPEAALELLQGVLQEEPHSAAVHRMSIAILDGLPGREREALVAADEFVRALPQAAEAYRTRGYLRVTAGRPEEALEDYKKAVAYDPTPPRLWDLAQALGSNEQWSECERVLARVVDEAGDGELRARARQALESVRARIAAGGGGR